MLREMMLQPFADWCGGPGGELWRRKRDSIREETKEPICTSKVARLQVHTGPMLADLSLAGCTHCGTKSVVDDRTDLHHRQCVGNALTLSANSIVKCKSTPTTPRTLSAGTKATLILYDCIRDA